jgi:hypothetical protein
MGIPKMSDQKHVPAILQDLSALSQKKQLKIRFRAVTGEPVLLDGDSSVHSRTQEMQKNG